MKNFIQRLLRESYTTNINNYQIDPSNVKSSVNDLKSLGQRLDQDVSNNVANLQILSNGSQSGRDLVEIGYPSGDVVLFYKSRFGTSGKEKGGWFPIPGFISDDLPQYNLPKGWFIKMNGVDDGYGSKTFQGTSDYLSATQSDLNESLMSENINYEFEHLDSYGDQHKYELGMYIDGEIVGMIEYTIYGNEILIDNILVRPEYRRKGFGSRMVKAMKQNHPEATYKPSMKTDLGAKFKHKDLPLDKID